VRAELTRERLDALMRELARTAPRRGTQRVHFVGGATAVLFGWRDSSLYAELHADDEFVFHDVQGVKQRLDVNIEFARPEQFVPPLPGTSERHVLVETHGSVSFFHYDPYAQVFSKLVRGLDRDLADARSFVRSGMVEPRRLLALVRAVPSSAYARYPRLAPGPVLAAVEAFVAQMGAPS
jgi:hypothetical protein